MTQAPLLRLDTDRTDRNPNEQRKANEIKNPQPVYRLPHSFTSILPIPINGVTQALAQTNGRFKPEQSFRTSDIGKGMADISDPCGLISRRETGANDILQFHQHLIESRALPDAEVDHVSSSFRR